MEKITQISINSTLFSLEESAYSKLSAYINEIREAFKDEVGGQEIVKDIEARIAEHLKNSKVEFITLSLVDEIIEKMGTVSELTGKDKDNSKTEEKTEPAKNIIEEKFKKRLFRDEENAILGGVCAGIAAYLDIDPTWVRVAFIALIFLGFGTIIPIYIVLWLIVPAAETTADKLEMRGNQVNLKTIVDTVRDKAKEYTGNGKPCENEADCKDEKPVKKTRKFIRRIVEAFVKVVVVFTGAMLAMISIGILVGFTAGLTALLTTNVEPSFSEFLISSGANHYVWLMMTAGIISITIPTVFMLIGGITLIRRKPIVQIRYGFAIFAVWMASIIALVIFGTHYGIKFDNYHDQINQKEVERIEKLMDNQDIITDASSSSYHSYKIEDNSEPEE